jgi:predicted ferric reductase
MDSLPWYVARSAGIVAWSLASASVLWGLFLSTRVLGRRPRANWLLDLHRFLGGLTVVFVLIHMVGLYFDKWVSFDLVQLLVPFTSGWNPGAVALGIVAMWLLMAVEVTSLLRDRIPKRCWRGVHFASYVVFLSGTVHLLLAGTDRHSTLLLWTVAAVSGAVALFTVYRIIGPGKPGSEARATIAPSAPFASMPSAPPVAPAPNPGVTPHGTSQDRPSRTGALRG